jgi:hypothetical protein
MGKHHLFAATAIAGALCCVSAMAADLNPQPLPPGARDNNAAVQGSVATSQGARSGMSSGAAAYTDDNYCGTPVPGHPHVGANCTNANVRTNAMIGSATSGAGAGKASDADDNYCGTPVPGHPHVGANCTTTNVRTNAMIGSATSGAGAGKASDADDNYCGTPVPGHPHVNANCTNNLAVQRGTMTAPKGNQQITGGATH